MKGNKRLLINATLKLAFSVYLGVFLGLCGVWLVNLGKHVYRLNELVQELPSELSLEQAERMVPLVEQAAGEVRAVQEQVGGLFPVLKALEEVPGVGIYLGQVEPVLSYAEEVTQAGNEVGVGLEPLLLDMQYGFGDSSALERACQVLEEGQEHFENAAEALERAREVRGEINPEVLPSKLRNILLELDQNLEQVAAGIKVLQIAPTLLGGEQEQSYLIMAQNRDELRATGGFITGIGLVSIQDGRITAFELGDSFRVDDFSKPYPTPPEPLKRFMLADYWVTRDANWSPDFPTAAEQTQALFSMSTGVETQGVIAFNQLAVEGILREIGPVEVAGAEELVSADNVEQYMWQEKDAVMIGGSGQERKEHRKDFMQPLSWAIVDKLLKVDNQEDLVKLGKALLDMVEQGQVLVYINNPRIEALLQNYALDGGVHKGESDYLYLVDSNVGFNKTDALMQRSVEYRVDLSDLDHPQGEVTISYQHTGSGDVPCKQGVGAGDGTYEGWQKSCYLDYWRVYVPGGSTMTRNTAQAIPAEELLSGEGWPGTVESQAGEDGSQVLAGLLMVPIGKSSQITIAYSLPSTVIKPITGNQVEYSIRIQVQPGIGRLPVKIGVRIPTGAILLNPGEHWNMQAEGTWIWQGVLDRSTEFSLLIQKNP